MSKIQTVTGAIDSAQLGLTLTHEHILNDVLSWWHAPLDDSPRARELVDEKVSMENLWELRHDPFVNKRACARRIVKRWVPPREHVVQDVFVSQRQTELRGINNACDGLDVAHARSVARRR